MAEASVLAGALHDCEGGHRRAFKAYDDRLLPFLRRKRTSAARSASAFAPKTAASGSGNVVVGLLRDDLNLPDYGF